MLVVLGVKSRTTIYERLRSDPSFPRPRRTGPHSVAWVRGEVDAWVAALPIAELDGVDAIERHKLAAKRPEAQAA